MTLAQLQRQLLELVKSDSAGPFQDPYLNQVASCEGLDATRHITRSWNAFSLERLCPLTCRLLSQRGEFEQAMAQLAGAELSSAFVEDLAVLFLAQQVGTAAPVVADVARFETAVLGLFLGWTTSETVDWCHHPDTVIGPLLAGSTVGEAEAGSYRTDVSLDLPGLYRVCG